MTPRGADAVVMVEHADVEDNLNQVVVRRAVASGFGVTFAGADIAAGEMVARAGQVLTSRETGVLAAIGIASVPVYRRPRVAVISTGDEIIPPGQPMSPGKIYDSNNRVLSDSIRELGCEPLEMGVVHDDVEQLHQRLTAALEECDAVLLSGGTSKGAGDLSYRAVARLQDPGIVAHGVALKPGKPICLAASQGKPVVVLPGFPTSAIFTFHEFVAPVLRRLAGRFASPAQYLTARLATKVNSEIGRTEYLLVTLVPRTTPPWMSPASSEPAATAGEAPAELAAYPMDKGSWSVSAFARADGFVTIDRHEEILTAGAAVRVHLLGRDLMLADLVSIGSHCLGLDALLGRLQQEGLQTKFIAVGSQGGLRAAARGECHLAGVHLLDPVTGQYNTPFLTDDLILLPGYQRWQGVVFRRDEPLFAECQDAQEAIARAVASPSHRMVNRNQGSGTRILIDEFLQGARPAGYVVQSKNHSAVAAAVAQGRADWGVAIEQAATQADLAFLPLRQEHYDFVAPRSLWESPAVQRCRALLVDPDFRHQLSQLGLT